LWIGASRTGNDEGQWLVRMDCRIASLLAMTEKVAVMAIEGKESRGER